MAAAARHPQDPLAFLRDRALFGDLVDEPRFVEPYAWALDALHRLGARATLQALQAQPSAGRRAVTAHRATPA
jgi:mannitol 2-dehydrogenase